jgi:hypothetical protein
MSTPPSRGLRCSSSTIQIQKAISALASAGGQLHLDVHAVALGPQKPLSLDRRPSTFAGFD